MPLESSTPESMADGWQSLGDMPVSSSLTSFQSISDQKTTQKATEIEIAENFSYLKIFELAKQIVEAGKPVQTMDIGKQFPEPKTIVTDATAVTDKPKSSAGSSDDEALLAELDTYLEKDNAKGAKQ